MKNQHFPLIKTSENIYAALSFVKPYHGKILLFIKNRENCSANPTSLIKKTPKISLSMRINKF
jgi:hypothetical protein